MSRLASSATSLAVDADVDAVPRTPVEFATPLRVLVVDDHVLFRHGLSLMLQAAFRPLLLVEAADLAEGEMGLTSLGRVDVVLLDLALRSSAGVYNLMRCRSLAPGAAVIAMADREPPDVTEDVLACGVDGLIEKTARGEAIARVILDVLAHHSPDLHPALAGRRGVLEARLPVPPGGGAPAIHVPHAMPRLSARPEAQEAGGARTQGAAELGLSQRQNEVLQLLADGLSNKAISRELGVAESTIKTHVIGLYQKLGVASRTEAVLAIAQRGLRTPGTGIDTAARSTAGARREPPDGR